LATAFPLDGLDEAAKNAIALLFIRRISHSCGCNIADL
jgi:hypothetical protein